MLPGRASRARFQPGVGRLDVAMDQAEIMSGGQALSHFPADAQRLRQGQNRFTFQPGIERLSLQELHGQVRNAAILADLKNRDDMMVLDGRGRSGLAQKTLLGRDAGGDARQHRLDGHHALQSRILGLVDDPHAAGAKDLQHAVLPQPANFVGLPRRRQKFHQSAVIVSILRIRIPSGRWLRFLFLCGRLGRGNLWR